MIRLLRSELRRVADRRLVRVTVVLAAIAIVIAGAVAFARTSSLSQSQYQQRVRAVDFAQRAQHDRTEACLHAHGVSDTDNFSNAVAKACFPDHSIRVHDPRFYPSRLQGLIQGSSGVLAIVGWALGASLVGAEFASRGMTTLLTWETRRMRVLVAKALAVLATVAALGALTLVALALAMLPSLLAHGAPVHSDDPGIASFAGLILRGTALAALAAGMGFAIATIGRNTAAALGAGFAYIIVLENILGSSLREWRRWLLLGNAIVFVSGSNSGNDVPGRSVAGAGLFIAAVAATLLVGSAFAFRSRDLA